MSENGDYGSQDVNHSNMRWLGHITLNPSVVTTKLTGVMKGIMKLITVICDGWGILIVLEYDLKLLSRTR